MLSCCDSRTTCKTRVVCNVYIFFNNQRKIFFFRKSIWVGFWDKGQLSAWGTWAWRVRSLHRSLSKEFKLVFTQVSEKTTKNSERLGRQARPRIEHGTSRVPVLRAELLGYWLAIGGDFDRYYHEAFQRIILC